MKKLAIIAVIALAFNAIPAKALDYVTKNIPVADFNSLVCNLPCEIEYTMGEPKCEVTIPEEASKHLVVAVNHRQLKITLDKVKAYKLGKIKVVISSPTLKAIELNGAVEFNAFNGLGTEDIDVTLNGASDLGITGLTARNVSLTANGAAGMEVWNIKCKKLVVCINGAGGCELSGTADSADLTVNGVGSIDAKKLEVKSMNSSVHGLGSISRN